MKINLQFFNKRLPLIIERDNLYLGQVYNNDTKMPERKILCLGWIDCPEDILFVSPNYGINGKNGYTVKKMVALGAFLKHLGYPENLRVKDIKQIYKHVLSSTKVLYQHCELFGVARVSNGDKGNPAYLPNLHRPYKISPEAFYKLEELISLPTNPSGLEKQNDTASFQKRLFFIS